MSIDVITIYIDMLGVSNALKDGEEGLETVASAISAFRDNFVKEFEKTHSANWNKNLKAIDDDYVIQQPIINSFSDCIQINIPMELDGLDDYKKSCVKAVNLFKVFVSISLCCIESLHNDIAIRGGLSIGKGTPVSWDKDGVPLEIISTSLPTAYALEECADVPCILIDDRIIVELQDQPKEPAIYTTSFDRSALFDFCRLFIDCDEPGKSFVHFLSPVVSSMSHSSTYGVLCGNAFSNIENQIKMLVNHEKERRKWEWLYDYYNRYDHWKR